MYGRRLFMYKYSKKFYENKGILLKCLVGFILEMCKELDSLVYCKILNCFRGILWKFNVKLFFFF